MKAKRQVAAFENVYEFGDVKISMLDEESHERFLLGLLVNCKQFIKDPKNLAEFNDWQEARKNQIKKEKQK